MIKKLARGTTETQLLLYLARPTPNPPPSMAFIPNLGQFAVVMASRGVLLMFGSDVIGARV